MHIEQEAARPESHCKLPVLGQNEFLYLDHWSLNQNSRKEIALKWLVVRLRF